MSPLKKPASGGEGLYLNRELSWLEFNERVLEQARSSATPLLERLRFLSIFESNLDEFFMVRVSGLIEQFESGVIERSPDGLTPNDQLARISETATPLRRQAAEVYAEVMESLAAEKIAIRRFADLTEKQQADLSERFRQEVFPLLTPLILSPAPSVPFISNRSLNLAVLLRDGQDVRIARVKVPSILARTLAIPQTKYEFVLAEDLIAEHLDLMFPGVEVQGSWQFRVIRDADVELREIEAADLIASIEETLRLRRFGDPVLLQVEDRMPDDVRDKLMHLLNLEPDDVQVLTGLLDFAVLSEIARIDRPDLRFPPHAPLVSDRLSTSTALFETIREQDVLVHHPYDSFRCVEAFVASAHTDPDVIGIKQTLYRVGKESPIVESLLSAAEDGKQVAAMVELKARFDESNNLIWARTLEQAGVHVTYGFADLKTHSKLCLVVRRETGGVKTYAHIGTGNYNPLTSRTYTDLGLFTCDPEITQDISELFNYLTGFSKQGTYRQLLVAPVNLREGILERIKREVAAQKATGKGRIIFKVNSLVDPEAIDALYAASQAGVQIDLIVRGICCLRPGRKGVSETIRVRSIVGQFLEHSRAYFFGNSGDPEVLIGSADLMRRNLDRRVEVLCPVRDPNLIQLVLENVLEPALKDNQHAWTLDESGDYHRVESNGEPPFSSQNWLMANPASKSISAQPRRRRKSPRSW
jgi:polyphosphate kinase